MSAASFRTLSASPGWVAPLLGALAMLPFLTGCPVPFPGSVHREIGEETIRRIEPGAYTRADVLLTLGNPEIRIENDSAFAYSWGRTHGGVIFVGPFRGAPAGAIAAESCHALAIQFAPDGVVARVKIFDDETTVSAMVGVVDGAVAESQSMGRSLRCTVTGFTSEIQGWLAEPVKKSP